MQRPPNSPLFPHPALSRSPALDAVLASAAIPGVFPPVGWEDTELIDGGVANNAPISHALELGFDRVYVLPTGASCELPEAPRDRKSTRLNSSHANISYAVF